MRLTVPASWTHRGRPGPRGKGKALPVPEGTATAPLPPRRKASRALPDFGPSEDTIQIALINHLKMRAVPGVVFWHVPNGGWRSKSQAKRFKDMAIRLTAAGAVAASARGLDAAIAQLEAWGLIRPDRSGS